MLMFELKRKMGHVMSEVLTTVFASRRLSAATKKQKQYC